ncbi:MAG: hypothetical protein Q7R85_03170 [bacterium]|nr:hypothetical protein [bacterium]
MVDVDKTYLILGAISIFLIASFWGRVALWNIYLYARYSWWRVKGGVQQLLDMTGKKSLHELFNIAENVLRTYSDECHYWTHFPDLAYDDAPKRCVAVGDVIPVGDLRHRDLFASALDLQSEKDATLLAVCFRYAATARGADARFFCHRRMSLAFTAFLVWELGFNQCPICRTPHNNMSQRWSRSMDAAAVREVARMERRFTKKAGEVGAELFAPESRGDSGSGVFCPVKRNVAHLDVYFGEPHALQLCSEADEQSLHPVHFEVIVLALGDEKKK